MGVGTQPDMGVGRAQPDVGVGLIKAGAESVTVSSSLIEDSLRQSSGTCRVGNTTTE